MHASVSRITYSSYCQLLELDLNNSVRHAIMRIGKLYIFCFLLSNKRVLYQSVACSTIVAFVFSFSAFSDIKVYTGTSKITKTYGLVEEVENNDFYKFLRVYDGHDFETRAFKDVDVRTDKSQGDPQILQMMQRNIYHASGPMPRMTYSRVGSFPVRRVIADDTSKGFDEERIVALASPLFGGLITGTFAANGGSSLIEVMQRAPDLIRLPDGSSGQAEYWTASTLYGQVSGRVLTKEGRHVLVSYHLILNNDSLLPNGRRFGTMQHEGSPAVSGRITGNLSDYDIVQDGLIVPLKGESLEDFEYASGYRSRTKTEVKASVSSQAEIETLEIQPFSLSDLEDGTPISLRREVGLDLEWRNSDIRPVNVNSEVLAAIDRSVASARSEREGWRLYGWSVIAGSAALGALAVFVAWRVMKSKAA
jgi:hypothetical protein